MWQRILFSCAKQPCVHQPFISPTWIKAINSLESWSVLPIYSPFSNQKKPSKLPKMVVEPTPFDNYIPQKNLKCHLPPNDFAGWKNPKKNLPLNHHQQQKGLGSPKTTRAWRHPSPPASPMPTLTRRRRRVWGGPVADSGWGNVSSWPTWMMTPWVFSVNPGGADFLLHPKN